MAKTSTFRRNRRRQSVLALVAVLGVALLTLGLYLLTRYTGLTPPAADGDAAATGGAANRVTTTSTVVTTTTYPTLSAETVGELEATLSGKYILLYDATHDKVLFSRNEGARCNPASLTKMMTAAVAAKYATDEPFEIGTEINLRDLQASSAYLPYGVTLTLPQLLQAMLLPSGGDAAYALAVTTARRLYPDETLSNMEAAQRFCDLMNETAAEIGAVDTHFVNPDGMYHTNHASTANDLLKILQFACSFAPVKEAMSLSSVSFTSVDGKEFSYVNTNRLLNSRTSYYYPYATGGKTGFTDEAGYCLASTAEKEGVRLMAIVMGCEEENARFTDSATLFNAGFALAGV